jgi:outer membrane protein assembly factor BamB
MSKISFKKPIFLMAAASFIFSVFVMLVSVQAYGSQFPSQWTEYAMNSNHNPVYESGSNWTASWKFHVPGAIPIGTPVSAIKHRYINITTVRDLVGIPIGVAVVNGMVYVPSDNNFLYTLNAKNGKLLWSFNALNQLMGTPIVYNGIVYIGAGNSVFAYSHAAKFAIPHSYVIRGVDVSAYYALNAKTGKLLWEYHTKGEDMPTPVYYNNKLIFGNGDGHIYALNAKTGKLLWKKYIRSFVSMSSAARYKNTVVMGGTHPNRLYAVNANTGKFVWIIKLKRVFSSSMGDGTPAISDNGIVVAQIETPGSKAGTSNSEELGINIMTGKIIWSTILGSGKVPPRNKDAVPMIHDGIVYTGSPVTKTGYALNIKNGKILWKRKLIRMKAAPVILHNTVYFPTGNGTIFALNKNNGAIIGRYKVNNGGFGPQDAVIMNNTMIIGTNFGWVDAIPLNKIK